MSSCRDTTDYVRPCSQQALNTAAYSHIIASWKMPEWGIWTGRFLHLYKWLYCSSKVYPELSFATFAAYVLELYNMCMSSTLVLFHTSEHGYPGIAIGSNLVNPGVAVGSLKQIIWALEIVGDRLKMLMQIPASDSLRLKHNCKSRIYQNAPVVTLNKPLWYSDWHRIPPILT
ncbi:hypothetical protein PsorP6_002209 [Peronosclerospora sorghi]|uniref:Uncharacterized protein n=1 Tax=Peronosclerospora sorghi TaxID=230839 RepID=A0ACC0WU95_9STRA|nr:hypothetical protein PsorP6_002209 [Peronosclerospora sorghi]